jgi:hypothetical protein
MMTLASSASVPLKCPIVILWICPLSAEVERAAEAERTAAEVERAGPAGAEVEPAGAGVERAEVESSSVCAV